MLISMKSLEPAFSSARIQSFSLSLSVCTHILSTLTHPATNVSGLIGDPDNEPSSVLLMLMFAVHHGVHCFVCILTSLSIVEETQAPILNAHRKSNIVHSQLLIFSPHFFTFPFLPSKI